MYSLRGRLALATLKQLGYRASLQIREGYWDTANDSKSGIQMGFFAWIQDHPSASNFLQPFTCDAFEPASMNDSNLAGICDPRIEHAIGSAPWASIVNWRNEAVVSRRVGNVQANPQWGVLIDQMWVR